MTNAIRIYKPHEIEYAKILTFVNLVNNKLQENKSDASNKYMLSVKNLLFDAGQNWEYTAVTQINLTEDENSCLYECHALCPRDYKFLVECDSFEKLNTFADRCIEHLNDRKIETPLCVGLE